ncbi:hypothetical protein BR93DRAFT_971286 [Coniochaeta sp. PMI_546]|nr:hypothetical protein BR93DRAFT_971286 [Coniochaeta sp. PMI_546]
MSESTSNPFAWLRLLSRDTSDIFFGCLTAIAASTFLALHLSVSAPHSDNSSRFLFKQWWASSPAHQFRRQLRWASMIVIAPELLVALAFGDWRAVSLGHMFFVRYGRGNVKSWTRTHASFANMSGFRFEVQRGGDVTPDSASYYDMLDSFEKEALLQTTWHDITALFNSTREKATKRCKKEALRVSSLLQPLAGLIERGTSKMKWKTTAQNSGSISTHRYEEQAESTRLEFQRSCTARTHESSIDHRPKGPLTGSSATRSVSRYLGITNIFSTTAGDTTHLPRNDTIILYLNAVQIVVAQALGVLDGGPSLTAEDIEDKGKSNIFIKGFAAAQLFWFATRIAIQLFRNQPLTQLELATFTYVLCALASYIFFWSKPQGVERPVQHRVYVSVTVRPITEEDITHLKRFEQKHLSAEITRKAKHCE